MLSKKKYSELSIYSPKISAQDYAHVFDQLIRKHAPLFEFLEFSRLFSLRGVSLVIKRYNNTVKIFTEDAGGIYAQSALLFPFRLNESKQVEFMQRNGPSFKMNFISSNKLFNFLVKEDAHEIHLRIVKFFGAYYGFGTFLDKNGRTGLLILSKPNKFLEIDLENNPLFYVELLDPVPKMIYLDSKEPIFSKDGINVGVDNFSPFQHSLIVGTSGTGKSKLLEMMIKSISRKYPDSRIVVVDPHGEFSKTFQGEKVIDFIDNYVEPFDVGKSKSPLIAQLVAQLITSTIGQESRYAERVVFYSVHLLSSIDSLTMENINLLLTDSSKRMEFTAQCQNDEVKRFFDKEFQDIYMHHFNDAILPVTNFIGEYLLYLGAGRKREELASLISKNRITVISFNPHHFSRTIIKFFAGAIINQMYMLAIGEKLDKRTVLVVDEFPTVESKVVKDILAETRKFNLYMYASAQYLGQLSKPVLDSLISNVRNVISFKVTKEDARLLSSMMEIKVEEFFKKAVSPSELEESKREMFVKLHTQECIIRLFEGEKYILPMKMKTVDVDNWRKTWEPTSTRPPMNLPPKPPSAPPPAKPPSSQAGGKPAGTDGGEDKRAQYFSSRKPMVFGLI